MLNQPEMVYAFYALNKIGATVCVVNVLSSEKELIHYLKESNSKYFLVLDAFFEKSVNAARQIGITNLIWVSLYESLGRIKRTLYRFKVVKPVEDEPWTLPWEEFIRLGRNTLAPKATYSKTKCSVIGHTGGTTGVPKGVMLTDDALNNIVFQYGVKWSHERGDSLLNLIVPYAIYGLVTNMHMPLCFGMCIVLIAKVNPQTTDQLLLKYKPSHVISIPGY